MEESSMFMQWAMNTLHHEQPAPAAVDDDCGEATFPSLQALREASHAAEMVQELIRDDHPTNSWSSGDGDTTDGSSSGNNLRPPSVMDHDVWPASPNSARRPVLSRSSGGAAGTNPPVSWNFSAASSQPGGDGGMLPETAASRGGGLPDLVQYGSPPTRRGGLRALDPWRRRTRRTTSSRSGSGGRRSTSASSSSPPSSPASRRSRSLHFFDSKMDKATILSDATRYVKELQEKLKDMEAGSGNGRSIETVVVVKRPCLHGAAAPDEDGSPLSASSCTPAASKQLPEIEARFSDKSVIGEDPLRERQVGGREGAHRGRGAPPRHRPRHCHAFLGLHTNHNHHGKGKKISPSLLINQHSHHNCTLLNFLITVDELMVFLVHGMCHEEPSGHNAAAEPNP
ncbi:hypothetical protein EJB05_05269, partial [Eragrostis curvula]